MGALGIMTFVSSFVAIVLTWSLPGLNARVVNLSIVCGSCSALYWGWAVKNLKFKLDLGAITFFFAFASSVVGIRSGLGGGDVEKAKLYRWGGPLAYALVSVNYILGLLLVTKPVTLRLYMIVGIMWWLLAGMLSLEFSA